MAGYVKSSMSKNALNAYVTGEKPLNKWTKKAILNEIFEMAELKKINISAIEKLKLNELKENFLKSSSWHHTSACFNKTEFYKIDENSVDNAKEIIKIALENRKKEDAKKRKGQSEKNATCLKEARLIFAKINVIFVANVLKIKKINTLCKKYIDGSLNFENTYKIAVQKLAKEEQKKVDSWRRLPLTHCKQKYVKMYDENIENYIFKIYSNFDLINSNCKEIQLLKNFLLSEINE